jgi:hypothetical protein
MPASSARVATDRPEVHLKQLCDHFADPGRRHSPQEFEVSFEDLEGSIDFAPVVRGSCRLDAREPGVLVLDARGADQAALERIERIVAKHVKRFGEAEGLTVEWGRASERPSTG